MFMDGTKRLPCCGPHCAERRVHWTRPDTPRGKPLTVEVREDYDGPVFCCYTCAIEAGAFSLKTGWDPEVLEKMKKKKDE